jgi:hypothetical protein
MHIAGATLVNDSRRSLAHWPTQITRALARANHSRIGPRKSLAHFPLPDFVDKFSFGDKSVA